MDKKILEQRELMIKLQAYDKKIIELNRVLEKVEGKIGTIEAGYDDEVKKKDSLSDNLKEKRKLYTMYENDMESNGQRIEKYEEHLKKLSNPKDYRALQREVDETRKLNDEIQETMISLLDEIESIEAELKEKEVYLTQLKSSVESEKEEILLTAKKESEEKFNLEQSTEEISKNLDLKVKSIYYDTLKRSGGVAIVPVVNQVCNGCFLRIPPQVQIEIKKGDELIFCPRCHRIVYLEEDRPI
ncbi:MAG: hypothetical protein CSA18_04025 [Deltaproteobacteria bacterium]|nr:MAG: hypothetical protein CSA18_04025 [Deltaproteobacteria bacterium]